MHDLAFNEDGEPFDVPAAVKGWRVRRASEGRGRPMLLHEGGKPLVLRVDASHADLLAAAGPGKYRLEAVDELRRRVDGVPHACTGPLTEDDDDDDDGPNEDEDGARFASGRPARRARLEDVVCQLLANQTRMVETTIGQLGTVIAGVANLLQAAHQSALTNRTAEPTAPASVPVPPPPPPLDEDDDGEDEDDDERYDEDEPDGETAAEAAPPSMLPEALRLIIEKTVDKLVPLIVEKVVSGELLSGIPLGALLDWRKAAPGATATPPSIPPAPPGWSSASAPATASAPTGWPPTAAASTATAPISATAPSPVAPRSWGPVASASNAATPAMVPATLAMPTDVGARAVPTGPHVPEVSAVPIVPSPPMVPEPVLAAPHVPAPPLETSALAGAAPSPPPQLGAAPAEAPRNAGPAPGALATQQDAAAALNAHILQIWRGLSPPERSRATQLIMGLSDAERAAWLAELARLSVADAIARARAVIATPPATAPPGPPSTPPASKE